ncbi:hypothetical protein MJ575_12015 [Klebsiella pneumoniae]|nr:hypothetical protein MJ575_12015 [Klebsiella pneumoniae]
MRRYKAQIKQSISEAINKLLGDRVVGNPVSFDQFDIPATMLSGRSAQPASTRATTILYRNDTL